jgi:hypothetical protein
MFLSPPKLTSIVDRNSEKYEVPFLNWHKSFSGGKFFITPVHHATHLKGLVDPALQVSTHLVDPPPLLFVAYRSCGSTYCLHISYLRLGDETQGECPMIGQSRCKEIKNSLGILPLIKFLSVRDLNPDQITGV